MTDELSVGDSFQSESGWPDERLKKLSQIVATAIFVKTD
jgi:hypothetical protein